MRIAKPNGLLEVGIAKQPKALGNVNWQKPQCCPGNDTVTLRFGGLQKTYAQRAHDLLESESERLYGGIMTEWAEALWVADYVDSTEEEKQKSKALETRKRMVFSDPLAYQRIRKITDDAQFKQLDLRTRRALTEMQKLFEANLPKSDNPEEARLIASIEAQEQALRDSAVSMEALMQNEPALMAKKQALMQLLEDRNQLAKIRGYGNFFEMKLAEKGWRLDDFKQIIQDVEHRRKPFEAMQGYFSAQEELTHHGLPQTLLGRFKTVSELSAYVKARPDHAALEAYREQLWEKSAWSHDCLTPRMSSIDMARLTVKQMGYPVQWVDDIARRSDFKGSWPYTLLILPPFDVRVRADIPEQLENADDVNALTHELLGHAIDGKMVDPTLPAPLKIMDADNLETFAIMMERLKYNPQWILQTVEPSQQQASEFLPHLDLNYLQSLYYDLRNRISPIKKEMALYEKPKRMMDPDNDYFILHKYPFLVQYPVYSYNYVLAVYGHRRYWRISIKSTAVF